MTVPFLETPRFPDDLSFWAQGGVSFNTTVTGSASGREQRNSLWAFGRAQFDLQNVLRTTTGVANAYSVQYIRNFFRVCKGQAYAFRFRDWTDYQDEGGGIMGAPVTSLIAPSTPTGYGNGTPTAQLYKKYSLPPLVDYRIVQKPYIVSLYRNGTLLTGLQATLDTTTGLVTFAPDSQAAVTGWTPGGSTSFTVAAVPAGWAIGKVLYFTGLTGSGAAALNNVAATITNISGTTVTVGVNTASTTLSGGTAYMYPQSGDALTWTGVFDTPCRFATDVFAPQIENNGALYNFQSLSVVEVRL